MPPDLKWFQGRANYLEEQNRERDDMFEALDQYRHGEWAMEEELLSIDWIHESRDPIFTQQGDSAKHILSDVRPGISLTPYNPGDADKDIADRHEKGLRWLLDSTSRRRQATIVQDLVSSSVDYSEITAQVVFIPQQIKDIKASGGNANRYESMLRRGPFAVIVHNPRTVYARYSDMGAEEVLLKTEDDPHNIIDLWGDKANKLKKRLKDVKGPAEKATLYDYSSYDWRCVWVEWGGEDYQIEKKDWPWPFMNWVCRYGGTSLEERGDFQRKPLLANMYHFDLYDDLNRVRSLRFSEMIRTASRAKDVFQSDTRTHPDLDSSTGDIYVSINTEENIIPQPPDVPDTAMQTLYGELRQDVQKSGLSEMLLGADVPTGAAFASINLVTESALKVLRTHQALAQFALADVLETMLLYIHYSNEDVISYGTGKLDRGEEYLIKAEEINPKNLYIDVTLEADLPTDYQARTVTARAQLDAGINSRENAMEDIGVKNVSEVKAEIESERMDETLLGTALETLQYEGSKELQDRFLQMAMEQLRNDPQFLQEVMQMMQAAQQGAEGGAAAGPAGAAPNGVPPNGQVDQQIPDDIGAESLVPSEANAAEGGPTTEEFAPQEIRRAQQEGLG